MLAVGAGRAAGAFLCRHARRACARAIVSRRRLCRVLPTRPRPHDRHGRETTRRRLRPTNYPEPVDHCEICHWQRDCRERRRADDHLSLVAGITRAAATRARGTIGRNADQSWPEFRSRSRSSRGVGRWRRTFAFASRRECSWSRAGSVRLSMRSCLSRRGKDSADCRSRRRATCFSISRATSTRSKAGENTCSGSPRPTAAYRSAWAFTDARRATRIRVGDGHDRRRDARASRDARLPLRIVRGHGLQASDGQIRDARA